MDLAKLRGWITDKTQQLGPDGRPINPQAVTLVVVRCHHPCVIVPRGSTPATAAAIKARRPQK